MKLFFVNCLLLFMFILFPMHSGYCDFFEGWQQGAAIGASIRESIERNRMLHGNQNQDIYVNKYYDFSKVHNMYLYVVLPNNQCLMMRNIFWMYAKCILIHASRWGSSSLPH